MFDNEISQAAATYNVPESWIRATIQTESSWDPNAFRNEPTIQDASYGLMQLLWRTAKGLGFTGAATELYNPALNIDLGAKLLGQLRGRFGDDYRAVYSAYNSGKANAWQYSDQVAANVARALQNLEKYEPAAAGGGVVLLLGLLVWWVFFKKKK